MPRIETTRMVRFALICLRVYLVVMLVLILTKFVGSCASVRQPPTPEKPAAAASNQTATAAP